MFSNVSHLQRDSSERLLTKQVSDNFNIIKLNWVRIFRTHKRKKLDLRKTSINHVGLQTEKDDYNSS